MLTRLGDTITCDQGLLIFMEAEKGNFYVSAVRRRTSAAKRTPPACNFAAELYAPPRRDKDSTPVTPLSTIN